MCRFNMLHALSSSLILRKLCWKLSFKKVTKLMNKKVKLMLMAVVITSISHSHNSLCTKQEKNHWNIHIEIMTQQMMLINWRVTLGSLSKLNLIFSIHVALYLQCCVIVSNIWNFILGDEICPCFCPISAPFCQPIICALPLGNHCRIKRTLKQP